MSQSRSDNTKLMAPKVWQHAIITANVARMRLKASGYKEPDEGVFIGILRSIALFSVCNHFSNCFDEAKEMVMQNFRKRELREEYFSCVDITPKLGFLPEIIQNWEKEVTRRIVDYIDWGPRNLHLKNALLEDIEDVPVLDRSLQVVTDWSGKPVCIIEIESVKECKYSDVSAEFAYLEGEGDRSLEWWRNAHWDFFTTVCEELNIEPTESMTLVLERFHVVHQ